MNSDALTAAQPQCRISPWLTVHNAEAAAKYYKEAFGVSDLYRLEDEEGHLVVAQLSVGAADFWIQDEPGAGSDNAAQGSVRMILTVEDPDSLFEQALAAGAAEVAAMHEEHGWRAGRLVDPFGHHWEICKRT